MPIFEPISIAASTRHGATIHVARLDGSSCRSGESSGGPGGTVRHHDHALCYVVAGKATLELHREITAPLGSFVVVPAGVPHRANYGSASVRWGVGFCASCLSLSETEGLMSPFRSVRLGAPPVVTVAPERHAWIQQLFQELDAVCARAGATVLDAQRALLVLLLTELQRAADPYHEGTTDDLASRALDFVWTHALEGISLSDVAAAVHASPSHVARMVKRATGATVGDWLRATRVANAASWLVHSDASIDEIAARVGWQDTTHFIRQFRKVHGTTPAAFRQSQAGG